MKKSPWILMAALDVCHHEFPTANLRAANEKIPVDLDGSA
jgi:hypothetical protein